MNEPDFTVFSNLYREAYLRCFRQELNGPITETESKIFYQQILEFTGLTVGWRSLKNYSFFVIDNSRDENPSVASMDTLARYVLKAPYTNEVNRKNEESYHPYWYMYRDEQLATVTTAKMPHNDKFWLLPVLSIIVVLAAFYTWYHRTVRININENFVNISDKQLRDKGWLVIDKDTTYWLRRTSQPGGLTLFTLPGDNWPDSSARPAIKNLMVHALPASCFTAELQIQGFIPSAEWQQAGLLLLEDTTLNSQTVRVSLAFNDLFGGFNKSKEVLVQAISSPGDGGKPEEFAHAPVLTLDSVINRPNLVLNLKQAALRIERQGNKYRFLYADGALANSAFKELAVKEIRFQPRYIALFALKGWAAASPVVPVHIKKFSLQNVVCE